MTNFSKEELLRLAEISSLKLENDEIDWLQEQLLKTIEYTNQLKKFELKAEHEGIKTINVFREDRAIQKESSLLLKQGPKTTESYFVVPKILDL